MKNKIDPKKEYSLSAIARLELIGAKSLPTVRDRIKEGRLKGKQHGEGKASMYLVKGEDIIKYNQLNK